MEHVKKGYGNRYTCINLTNADTIEFRIFRGTLKLNTLIATLQMVSHICDVAIALPDEDLRKLSWSQFVASLGEPELVQYLKERRLYVSAAIAEETQISPKNVEEILMGGLLNMNITDFYRHYGDEDSEESMEEVAADGTSQTEELYFRIEKAEEVMSTFESLNYRERAIVADHLGFCRDCYTTHYYDENDLDSEGKPKRKPRRKGPFIELAVEHGLASPDTADRTYCKALQKMHQKLIK